MEAASRASWRVPETLMVGGLSEGEVGGRVGKVQIMGSREDLGMGNLLLRVVRARGTAGLAETSGRERSWRRVVVRRVLGVRRWLSIVDWSDAVMKGFRGDSRVSVKRARIGPRCGRHSFFIGGLTREPKTWLTCLADKVQGTGRDVNEPHPRVMLKLRCLAPTAWFVIVSCSLQFMRFMFVNKVHADAITRTRSLTVHPVLKSKLPQLTPHGRNNHHP